MPDPKDAAGLGGGSQAERSNVQLATDAYSVSDLPRMRECRPFRGR